jgi:probable F420-dependent oxidoreductase
MDVGPFGIWWSGWQEGDAMQESVAEMEELGYGTLWLSGGFSPGLSSNFGRLLAATRRTTVASGIINTWLTPAGEMAAAVGELEERFPGRFLLGLGVSHAPIVDGWGENYRRPFSQMVGYLDELDAARPTVAADRRILAALGPKMLGIAAERSLGAHPYFVTVEHTVFAREALGQGPLLAPEVAVVLETDAMSARRLARGYMAVYLSLPNYVNNLRRIGWTEEDVAGGGSDRLVDALIPWGSAGAVARRLREHRDAGADHVCVQLVVEDHRFPAAGYRQLAGALGLDDARS